MLNKLTEFSTNRMFDTINQLSSNIVYILQENLI